MRDFVSDKVQVLYRLCYVRAVKAWSTGELVEEEWTAGPYTTESQARAMYTRLKRYTTIVGYRIEETSLNWRLSGEHCRTCPNVPDNIDAVEGACCNDPGVQEEAA